MQILVRTNLTPDLVVDTEGPSTGLMKWLQPQVTAAGVTYAPYGRPTFGTFAFGLILMFLAYTFWRAYGK